jgi:hypothetical protein
VAYPAVGFFWLVEQGMGVVGRVAGRGWKFVRPEDRTEDWLDRFGSQLCRGTWWSWQVLERIFCSNEGIPSPISLVCNIPLACGYGVVFYKIGQVFLGEFLKLRLVLFSSTECCVIIRNVLFTPLLTGMAAITLSIGGCLIHYAAQRTFLGFQALVDGKCEWGAILPPKSE